MGHGASGRDGHAGRGRAVHARHAQCLDDLSADDELGLVYVPMGNSAVDYFSGNREDYEHPYSTALVALDITSGEVAWVFQTVHNDVWDYDLGSQGTLADFPMGEGQSVPAVILPTKQGDIFVLDRRTGEPLTEVQERPVPASKLPDEQLSPTQPFSVGMPTLAKPKLTERDAWGFSPLDQLWCRIQFLQSDYEDVHPAERRAALHPIPRLQRRQRLGRWFAGPRARHLCRQLHRLADA